MPIGWRVDGNASAVRSACETGVKDLIIDMSGNGSWQEALAEAEKAGARYIISVGDKAAEVPAFVVRPSSCRIDKVPRKADYSVSLPGVKTVFYLLLTTPDYVVANKGWSDVRGGTARITVNETISGGDFLLLLYPRADSAGLPDWWEGQDVRRDNVVARLRESGFGAGLRGILNPAGILPGFDYQRGGVVPDSPAFRIEFEDYLQKKYKDVVSLERAWKLTSTDLRDFKTAARFIGLFGSTGRGAGGFLDPQNNAIYGASAAGSSYWRDIQSVLENAASRRTTRFATALKQIANVPIVFEWNHWSPIYDTSQPAGDGLGMRAIGVGLSPVETFAANAASTALSWPRARWLIATDVSVGNGAPYANEASLRSVISDTHELGAKGWFVRWTGGAEAAWLRAMAEELKKDGTAPTRTPTAVFYPENAQHPATTMRLPSGVWWLPTPAAGERLELGPLYEGYRHVAKFADFIALWRTGQPATVKLRMVDPSRAKVTRFDGGFVETKVLRDGIEVTLDNLPTIIRGTDEIPIPQDAIDIARADYQSLVSEAKKKKIDVGDFRFGFEDALRTIDRNPGASFLNMMESLRELQRRVAPYVWVEGEAAVETTIGEIVSQTATSAGAAFEMSTPMKPGPEGYSAGYRMRFETDGQANLWIAARVPDAVKPYVTLEIAGQKLPLPKDGVSGYGDGFAWYSVGNVALRNTIYTLTVRISPASPTYEMAIDAVLATPNIFIPRGPKLPRWIPGELP
jgi:hypothetical protein